MFGSPKFTDAYIITKIKEGDEKMLVYLYKQNLSPVRKLILANNGQEADAEDVLQDCLINLWEKLQKEEFVLTAAINTYIYAVARNKWLKSLRKNSRQSSVDFNDYEMQPIKDETENSLEHKDRYHVLMSYMDKLPFPCKKILSLFYFEQWDMEKIAAELNYANAKTAKAKKYQCKKYLESGLRKYFDVSDLL